MKRKRIRGMGIVGLILVLAIVLFLGYLYLKQAKENPTLKPALSPTGQGFQPEVLKEKLIQQTRPHGDPNPEKTGE